MNNFFNILDCFDDNISNLDITKNYVYVLKLIEERYYVGRTGNILRRIEEHFTSNGSKYTMKYNPLKVIEIEEELTSYDERNKTLEYMKKYGYEKVRGYVWCKMNLKYDPTNKPLTNKCNLKRDFFMRKVDVIDETLKKLYFEENKNILEIGSILNRTPGSIAWELECSGLVKRRQLTRGYFEYVNSDIYKQNMKPKELKQELSSSNPNLEAKMLKKSIRDIINKNNKTIDIKNKLRLILTSVSV